MSEHTEDQKEVIRLLGSLNNSVSALLIRVQGVEARIDGLDGRLKSIDSRLELIEKRLRNIENYVPSDGQLPAGIPARAATA